MNPLEQVALGWQALRFAAGSIGRRAQWTPWLWPLAAQALVLGAIVFAAHPLLSWAMAPLLNAIADEDVVRYPELFRRLPALASRTDLVVAMTLGSIAAGASTRLFAERFSGHEPRAGVAAGEAWSRAFALVVASLPVHAFFFGSALAVQAAERAGLSRLTLVALPFVVLVAGLLVQAAWAYASALVILERRSAFSAIAALPGTWRRGFLPALVLVSIGALILLPLQLLAGQTELIVDRGLPELTAWLSALQTAAATLVSFLVTGGAAALFLSALSSVEEAV